MNPKDARSVEALTRLVAKATRTKYLFFWGHRPRVPDRIDHSCLSNWFPAKFTVDGVEYPTTEHFMMAEKARLFGDSVICDKIVSAETPGAAKSLGRRVANFDEATWVEKRFEIAVRGNEAKFSQNEPMRDFLIASRSKVLAEASPNDQIWGIGMDSSDDRAKKPNMWNGLNLLGFALMEVRERFKIPKIKELPQE